MLTKLKELREANEEGFTLIELLVVIVIIGVLAAIALPIFLNQQKAAIAAGVKADVKQAQTAVATYFTKSGNQTATLPTTTVKKGANDLLGQKVNISDDGTEVVVTGNWQNWTVTGTNANAGSTPETTGANPTPAKKYTYSYDSATGKYTETTP